MRDLDPRDDERPGETAWERVLREHAESLTVGTRVHVMPGEGCRLHGDQEAGITGVIVHAAYPDEQATHRYMVLFDRPLWITRSSITTWTYAAAELTPIPWPTPEEIVADTLRRVAALDADA